MSEISLTQGRVALVDDEDYERVVAAGPWHANLRGKTWYAWSHGTPPLMHRLIIGARTGQEVDHINHDGLDNRKANLRLASKSQNQANATKRSETTSRFKGVCRYENGWQAYIHFNGDMRHLGFYVSEDVAARAYDDAARQQWGEFALTNF